MKSIKPFIIKNIIYPVYGCVSGRHIIYCAKELEKTQWMTTDELENLQWRKLRAILANAQNDVPYYQQLFKRHGINVHKFQSPADLSQIPILLKRDIRKNQKGLLSARYKEKDLKRSSTSGSTGENIYFYHDRNCRAWFLGNIMRNHRWMRVDIGEPEIMIWGSAFDLSAAGKITGRIKSFLANISYLSAFDLHPSALESHIAFLRKKQAPLISGYASALYIIANYMIEHNVNDIRPKGVISSAEMLFPHQKGRIEKAFRCKVFNRYGCREFATVAHECEYGNQHITMERVYVEIASEQDRQWGVEPGDLIITDLDNNGMPMIRYNIGDMGALEERNIVCKCGRGLSLLREIKGRAFDVIKTPSGHMLPGTFWTILSKAVPGIVQFQVIQKKIDEIEMSICLDESFPHEKISDLHDIIQTHCGSNMYINIRIVDHIPLSKFGKFRYVISEID